MSHSRSIYDAVVPILPTISHEDTIERKNTFLLQKQITPSLCNQRHIPADMSETEAVSMIVKGHESMMAVMTNRNKNLQVVRALWTSGNMKVSHTSTSLLDNNFIIVYNFIQMATIAVELYNWHSKTTNDNKLIKKKIMI